MNTPKDVIYETLFEEIAYKVSTMRMEPGSRTQWHTHSEVSDIWVVCSGQLVVDYQDKDTSECLEIGQHFSVPPDTKHRVRNVGREEAFVLLAQVGGKRDFIPVLDM